MTRTHVKICGITNLADADSAARLGADALGFVLYRPSSRFVAPESLAGLFADLPPGPKRVAVFVDEDPGTVKAILADLPFDLLQFHGDESPEYCALFDMPYIKAIRASTPEQIAADSCRYEGARALLVDTDARSQFGGTGVSFDWRIWARMPRLRLPLVLAGGLTAGNVGEAISLINPWAIDVSSGVEQHHGKKDPAKLAAFFTAVNAADAASGSGNGESTEAKKGVVHE